MKQIFSLACLITMVIFFGCKKASNGSLDNQAQSPFLDSSVQFLKHTLSNEDFDKLDLESNQILKYHGNIFGAQIFEKNIPHDKFILIGTGSGRYHGNWVDMSDLKLTQSGNQSGSITIESPERDFNIKLKVDNNEVIQVIKSGNNKSGSFTIDPLFTNLEPDTQSGSGRPFKNEGDAEMLPEVIVECYACLPDVPSIGYSSLFWLFGGNSGYSDFYIGTGTSTRGGGGNGAAVNGGNHAGEVVAAPTFISPDKPISNLKHEFRCFTNNDSSTYSISVNVNEPYPNSRDVYNPLSSFSVGHTFLTLQQHNPDGSIIIRNVGFYPRNAVKPGASIDKSTFGDDSYTPFDISLQFNVNGGDFNTVLNILTDQQSYNYDLNNFNCTSSSIDALKYININLPNTKAADILFTGNNPADLGEDIRNLNLDNFSAANGKRQFTRTMSDFNDQNPPARQGICP